MMEKVGRTVGRLALRRWSVPVGLWVALVLYMVVIYSLSSAPLEEQGPSVTGVHEAVEEAVTAAGGGDEAAGERWTPAVEHLLVYAGLGALALAAWSSLRLLPLGPGRTQRWTRVAWKWSLPMAVGVVFCYGVFDEWHQGWVAGRTASMDDVVWDIIGGATGAMAVLVFRSMFVRDGWLRRWAVAV